MKSQRGSRVLLVLGAKSFKLAEWLEPASNLTKVGIFVRSVNYS
jgi:hypothetical protein